MQLLSDADLAAQRCAGKNKLAQLHAERERLDEQISAETTALIGLEDELRQRQRVATKFPRARRRLTAEAACS